MKTFGGTPFIMDPSNKCISDLAIFNLVKAIDYCTLDTTFISDSPSSQASRGRGETLTKDMVKFFRFGKGNCSTREGETHYSRTKSIFHLWSNSTSGPVYMYV